MSSLCQILVVLAISKHPFHSGSNRDFKNYQEMTSDFYFILIPKKCPRKTPFKTQWGVPLSPVSDGPDMVKARVRMY